MDTEAIIDRLGGTKQTSLICGVTQPAVALWKKTGIPPAHWRAIVDYAEANRIPGVSYDTVQAARKSAKTH